MLSLVCRIWPVLLLGGFALPGVRYVCGIDIYTASELEVANGTDVRLKCTFRSTHPVSAQSVTVSWNFRPLNLGAVESVFYYQEAPYPPQQGRFKGHAVWSGDIMRSDASITLHTVPPTFNGTFICQVRNRPDVHGSNGEINLRVVNKVSYSEIGILAIAVGGACGVVLILLGIFVAVRFCRKKHSGGEFEMHPREEWKDPTVCLPEEAVHLKVLNEKKEADSSDEEESEPSSGDDDEEEGEEEDDDDDDDDEDDDDGDDGGGDD